MAFHFLLLGILRNTCDLNYGVGFTSSFNQFFLNIVSILLCLYTNDIETRRKSSLAIVQLVYYLYSTLAKRKTIKKDGLT